jgi:hypothetical protein
MNDERKMKLQALIMALEGQLRGTYERGQKEHGGDLWKKACFPRLKPELIDAFTYAFEHEQRMMKWLKYLSKASDLLATGHWDNAAPLVEKIRDEVRLELSVESAEEVFTE